MEKILALVPSLSDKTEIERLEAVVRMCIAHVLNGGAYKSAFVTAAEYLEWLGE